MIVSLDILCCNPLNLKNKIMKTKHKKIFGGSSKIFKNISWPINICLKYFMTLTKTLRPPSYILNVRFLSWFVDYKPTTFLKIDSFTLLRFFSKFIVTYIMNFSRAYAIQNSSGFFYVLQNTFKRRNWRGSFLEVNKSRIFGHKTLITPCSFCFVGISLISLE